MNIIALPLISISLSTYLIRSSKSPLYFDPATIAPISTDQISLSASNFGTSLSTIFLARPSAIAVLPTPASPTIITLFLRLRASVSCNANTSSSRPINGSILLSSASLLRFTHHFSISLSLSSFTSSVIDLINSSLSRPELAIK